MYSAQLDANTNAKRELIIPMIAITASKDKTTVLRNIFFESGSYILLPTSETELRRLWMLLKNNGSISIEIRGHTDNVGAEVDNLALSEARAKSVYDYLVGRGIAPERLSYKGFGETMPVATNETETGRRENRRTEFVVKGE
jgi:outer membrane protein OmpA-like peptidoglycan-associated protein